MCIHIHVYIYRNVHIEMYVYQDVLTNINYARDWLDLEALCAVGNDYTVLY